VAEVPAKEDNPDHQRQQKRQAQRHQRQHRQRQNGKDLQLLSQKDHRNYMLKSQLDSPQWLEWQQYRW
jgi:hypothetical protein